MKTNWMPQMVYNSICVRIKKSKQSEITAIRSYKNIIKIMEKKFKI